MDNLEIRKIVKMTLTATKEQFVPKRLSLVKEVEAKDDRSKIYLFVDNNGRDAKISLKDINSKILRTVNEVPTDLQVGEYIFLEIEEE